jgi:hypothetical protein
MMKIPHKVPVPVLVALDLPKKNFHSEKKSAIPTLNAIPVIACFKFLWKGYSYGFRG